MAKYDPGSRKGYHLNSQDNPESRSDSIYGNDAKNDLFSDSIYSGPQKEQAYGNQASSGGHTREFRQVRYEDVDDDRFYDNRQYKDSGRQSRSGRDYSRATGRYNDDYRRPPKKKKKKTALVVILVIVIILLGGAAFFGVKAKAEVNDLKADAYVMKDELKVTLSAVKELNPDAAEDSMEKVLEAGSKVQERLDQPFWKLAAIVPVYGADVSTAKQLLQVLDNANESVVQPFITQLREHPLSDLKGDEEEGGLNVSLVLSYLDFLDQVEPEIKDISEEISEVHFNTIDFDMEDYAEKFNTLFESLSGVSEYKDLLRAVLGNGQDRLYLIMAQNSAEIRASGGFPGSMGTLRIQDGTLRFGDFSTVLDYLYAPTLPEANITEREVELFRNMYASWSHDACYNPHFAKVASITKAAYDYRNGESLDGVISMTPEVIQKILELTGKSIYLDDGTELDGTNATRILQRDLYIQYQADDATAYDNNVYIDPLFAQTAKQTMSILAKDLDFSKLPGYLQLFKEGCRERTMMLWLADEEEEQICIDAGCSGNLNADPENPVAGVYFSCCDPGKVGMFTEINTSLSEPTANANGQQEYTVTVTLNNYINEEDITGVSSTYLLGSYGGAIQSYVYFFAPAGGTVRDFETSNGMPISMSEYEDLQVGYNLDLMIYPDSPVTITYKVTTAAGVETPLQIESTPTLQEYR